MKIPRVIPARKISSITVLLAAVALAACSETEPHVYAPSQRIEHQYSKAGPYSATRIETPARFGLPRGAAYLPGDAERPAPLVIWQNGTGVDIDTYDAIARHLASWGLAVLGSYDRQMGSGQTAIAMLENARLWSSTPGHPLHGRVAAGRFAFVGSSQGAVGTINAHTEFSLGRTATALAVHGTPTDEAIAFFGLDLQYDATRISAPIFIMTGTEDDFISPISLNETMFHGLSGEPMRAIGVASGADHIELADDAGRMRGYLTAWLSFQLTNDPNAAQAFLGIAEITTNPGWSLARVAPRQRPAQSGRPADRSPGSDRFPL